MCVQKRHLLLVHNVQGPDMGSFFGRSKRRDDDTVVVFTRYPVSGFAKTRLIPALGEAGAALAQVYMTEHIVSQLAQIKHPTLDVQLHYYGGSEQQMEFWWRRKLEKLGLSASWQQQQGDHLGEKMKISFKKNFDSGVSKVVIVGSDIPGIDGSIIKEAFTHLNQPACQMVLGPAKDGGYYLVGLKRDSTQNIGALFENIEWGTNQVFSQQCERAKQLGINVTKLSRDLQDVDVPEDLPELERTLKISAQSLRSPKISVVIPVLNEANNIQKCIENVTQNFSSSGGDLEVIVSDGGSVDDTVKKVEEIAGSVEKQVRVINSEKGRGCQLINGANQASGDILLFVHADTLLPKNYDNQVTKCLGVPGNIAGAFKFGMQCSDSMSSWFKMKMRWLEWGVEKRCKHYELPYGDQCLFLTRRNYELIGGYPDFPLMEDYAMIEKLRQHGHIGIAEGDPCLTSARRWEKHGYVKITGLNQLFILAYKCGIAPATLAKWYYGTDSKKDK